MHVKDNAALAAHVGKVTNDRTHWVFGTDNQQGHLVLVGLGVAMATRCQLDGVNADPLLHCGVLSFLSVPSMRRSTLSFLTVPKDLLSSAEMAFLLVGLGVELSPHSEEQDLVMIASDDIGNANLTAFIAAARDGKLHPQDVALN